LTSQPLKVTKLKEPWCVYELEDGTTLRFRATVHNIRRLEGKFTAVGDPEYSFNHQIQIETIAPQHMRCLEMNSEIQNDGARGS
jgi:hypothetical protein